MITEMLALQQAERQTVTINTAAYDVRVSNGGYNFLRQCRQIAAMGNYGYRYFQPKDNIILRSILVQVPAPISVSSQGIPLVMYWKGAAAVLYPIIELMEDVFLNPKMLAVPFENSELVINTPCNWPAGASAPLGLCCLISQDASFPDHADCRFHMTGLNAAFNTKVIPITVYARIEHTLPMIAD